MIQIEDINGLYLIPQVFTPKENEKYMSILSQEHGHPYINEIDIYYKCHLLQSDLRKIIVGIA